MPCCSKNEAKSVYSPPLSEYNVLIFLLKWFSTRALNRRKMEETSNFRLKDIAICSE